MIRLRDLPDTAPPGVMLRCPDGCCTVSASKRDFFYLPDDHEFMSYCEQPLRLVREVISYRPWSVLKAVKP